VLDLIAPQTLMDEETGERLPRFGDVRQTISEMLVVAARCSQ